MQEAECLIVRWRLAGQEWQEKAYPLDRLEEVLERAWLRFGDPDKALGWNTKPESERGYVPIPQPLRRSTRKRAGR